MWRSFTGYGGRLLPQIYGLNSKIKIVQADCLTKAFEANYYICLMKAFFAAAMFALLMAGCTNTDTNADANNTDNTAVATPVLSYNVAATYPHDTSSFTQGLSFYNGQLLEGTGNKGKSKLLQVDMASGKALKKVDLDPTLFGEGIVVLNDTLYQLTWQEKVVLLYNAKTFEKIGTLPLGHEGWGITTDSTNLIVTDGSNNLYFYEPGTFRLLRTQGVTEGGAPAVNLNELEFINGFVYANQYMYPYILKIDPQSGQVVGKLDLSELIKRNKALYPGIAELNGIAYNSATDKIYVTGKWWPELYEIQFPH